MAARQDRFESAGEYYYDFQSLPVMDTTTKRRRVNTGGAGVQTGTNGLPYTQVADFENSRMSDSEKLNYLCSKMAAVESLSAKMHNMDIKLNDACGHIDQLSKHISTLEDEAKARDIRLIDLEARSRRNNLIFTNIPECNGETNELCEATLIDFLKNYMKLGQVVDTFVFQRVHRLGMRRMGVAPNGDAWKPRSIIAGFRDFKAKEFVLRQSNKLKGSIHAIQQDFPAEIRSARGKLWSCKARANNRRASIVYPAKLVIEGRVVKDEMPDWNKRQHWDNGDTNQGRPRRQLTLWDYTRQPSQPERMQPQHLNAPPPITRTGGTPDGATGYQRIADGSAPTRILADGHFVPLAWAPARPTPPALPSSSRAPTPAQLPGTLPTIVASPASVPTNEEPPQYQPAISAGVTQPAAAIEEPMPAADAHTTAPAATTADIPLRQPGHSVDAMPPAVATHTTALTGAPSASHAAQTVSPRASADPAHARVHHGQVTDLSQLATPPHSRSRRPVLSPSPAVFFTPNPEASPVRTQPRRRDRSTHSMRHPPQPSLPETIGSAFRTLLGNE